MDSMSSITKNGKKRSPNYTPSEVVTIQEEVIKNRQLLEGKYNDLVTKRKVQRCWEHITEIVNAAGLHSRTVIDIKEKWRSMRKNAKRDFAEKKKESLKTGGGGPPATLSASSQRIIEEYQGSASFNGIPGASSLESIVLSENGNNDPYLIYVQDLASGEDNHLVTLDVNPEDFDLPIGGSELELHNEDRPPFEEFIDPITTASETRAKETTHESNSNNKESRKRYIEEIKEDEEPPLKKPRLEIGSESIKLTISNGSKDIQVISPTLTRNTDLVTTLGGIKENELIRMPSKTDDSGFLSPSSTKSFNDLIQSPADSAYDSYPWTSQTPFSVGASSGIVGSESIKLTLSNGSKDIQVISPALTRNTDLVTTLGGTKEKESIRTPSKTDSSFLSPSSTKSFNDLIQSPTDSAYNSYSGKSPLTPQIILSVGTSSGIGTDSPEFRIQTVEEKRTQLHQEQLESGKLSKFLQRNFSMLKEEMEPNGIADHLYNYGVIDSKTTERIGEEKYRAKKCDILIKAIAQSHSIKKPCTEQKLRKAFEAENCLFLLDDLWRDSHTPGKANGRFSKMEVTAKLRLLGKEIEDRIEPRDIIDDLVTTGMLTLLEHDDIMTTDYKANRMTCLMAYLMKEPELHFPKFCDAVENRCSDLGKKLLQKYNPISSLDQKVPKLQIHAKVEIRSRNDGICNDQDQTYVKFNLQDDKEMEKLVVEEHTRNTSPGLDEQVMELGFIVGGIQFSSIKINLTKLSLLSQVRLYEQIEKSPQFLENWLQNLLSHEHLKAMQSRGLSTASFEIHIQKPSTGICLCKLMKKNIVTHFSHLEKAMKNVNQILKGFGDFPHFDSEARLSFNEMRSKDERNVEAFLLKILQMEDIAVCLLQRELINTGQASLLDGIVDNNTCTALDCISNTITVKSLRKCHSFLQDEIEPRKFICNIDKMKDQEEVWNYVMSNAPRRHRIKKFLDFIHKEGQIAVDQFVQSLEAEKKTNILNVLRSVDSYKQLSEKDADRLRDSLLLKFDDIIREVDSHNLRPIFIERKVMKAKDFDALVCKHPTQKSKIASLLKHVLQCRDSNALVSFMHAIETKGYADLVARIKKEAESCKPCPRLDMGTNDGVVFRGFCQLKFFKAAERESPLQLELHKRIYRNERSDKSSDQSTPGSVSKSDSSRIEEVHALTRRTVESKPVDKGAYTCSWVANLPGQIERPGCFKGKICTDDEEHAECFNNTDDGGTFKGPNTPPGKYFVNDTDSGIDTISSINGSIFKRIDEAIETHSRITEDGYGSLPTSPSTTITLYENISPPSSPSAIHSFVPSENYKTTLSLTSAI